MVVFNNLLLYECVYCIVVIRFIVVYCETKVHRSKRALPFPGGSQMGLYYAFSIPIDLPNRSVSMNLYIEANYNLPDNSSILKDWQNGGVPIVSDEEKRKRRSLDRTVVYKVIENKLETHGFPGQPCLLRTICEVANSNLEPNGLLGELIYIILTPSSSRSENLPVEFEIAERTGRHLNDCSSYYNDCYVSFLDLISNSLYV